MGGQGRRDSDGPKKEKIRILWPCYEKSQIRTIKNNHVGWDKGKTNRRQKNIVVVKSKRVVRIEFQPTVPSSGQQNKNGNGDLQPLSVMEFIII